MRAGRRAAADGLAAQRLAERGLDGVRAAVGGGEDERRDAAAEPERLEAARELGAFEVAADGGGEHVAGEPALGGVGDAAPQQLEGDDGDGLVGG